MKFLLILTLVLASACAGSGPSEAPTNDITLTISPDPVAAGGTVMLTLRNDSSGAIGYNLCNSGLAREAEGEWEELANDRVCTMELRTLQAGQEDEYQLDLPATLAPGRYRFQTTIEVMASGTREDIPSAAFQVTR